MVDPKQIDPDELNAQESEQVDPPEILLTPNPTKEKVKPLEGIPTLDIPSQNLDPKQTEEIKETPPGDIKEQLSTLGISPKSNPAKPANKTAYLLIGLLLLLVSIPAGVFLVKQRQEIRKEAGTAGPCFYPPQVYQPAPYEYHLEDTHSPGNIDWVTFGIKDECTNVETLTNLFGPLDNLGNNVYITQSGPYQYGFTFNRIMHIDGYDDAEIQAGIPALTEEQLHQIHLQGQDQQSIQDCDKNGRQVVFDLDNKIAKPNGWTAWETGYYQFDLTPKFQCDGTLHQNSEGAGFIRVVAIEGPTPTPTPTSTPTGTLTPTPTPTSTLTPTPTGTPTPTPTPTGTPTPTPTGTLTPTPTPTPTGTPAPTPTPTSGPTSTPVSGPTSTPTPEVQLPEAGFALPTFQGIATGLLLLIIGALLIL